ATIADVSQLENIGHLFKAANKGSRSATAARAAQLKRSLPKSISSFHDALDSLEEELQMAKAVMRRDLAVCRQQPGQDASDPQTTTQLDEAAAVLSPTSTAIAPGSPVIDVKPVKAEADDAVQVQDLKTAHSEEREEPQVESVSIKPEIEAIQPDQKDASSPTSKNEASALANADMDTGSKLSEPMLKVDTSMDIAAEGATSTAAHQDSDDNKPPDTATVSEGQDLESLFNDPASAGGSGAGTTTNPGTGPATGTGTGTGEESTDFAGDFEFGTFTQALDGSAGQDTMDTDDSISALLPGLQDYANTQPAGAETEEPDFNALFATDAPMVEDGQGGEAGAVHGDAGFDEIMSFADFNNAEFSSGGNGQGGSANGNESFNFDFD
ncbi:hypothetical protein LTR53_016399, partial [Teratosphaeriaceae sp. CCFEE 6253]